MVLSSYNFPFHPNRFIMVAVLSGDFGRGRRFSGDSFGAVRFDAELGSLGRVEAGGGVLECRGQYWPGAWTNRSDAAAGLFRPGESWGKPRFSILQVRILIRLLANRSDTMGLWENSWTGGKIGFCLLQKLNSTFNNESIIRLGFSLSSGQDIGILNICWRFLWMLRLHLMKSSLRRHLKMESMRMMSTHKMLQNWQ